MKIMVSRVVLLTAWFAVGAWYLAASPAHADPGLLIIAHGAPSSRWNEPVLQLGQKVADEILKDGRFVAVRTAMLEFNQGDVPQAIAELEAEGCDRIVAVPLFIAPSGHSHFDVPAVLGIYSSPRIMAAIAEEGGTVARPKVPITLTQTLDGGNVLCTFALDQVRKLSKNPAQESLILIAHGDDDHQRLVDGLMRRITTYCCGQTGIDYGDWAFVEVGQSYLSHGVPAIMAARKHKSRVLVVGIYVSSSAQAIHERAIARTANSHTHVVEFFEENDVVFSREGLVRHPAAVQWVLDAARHALETSSDGRNLESR